MSELLPTGGSEGYEACDDEGRGLLDAPPDLRAPRSSCATEDASPPEGLIRLAAPGTFP